MVKGLQTWDLLALADPKGQTLIKKATQTYKLSLLARLCEECILGIQLSIMPLIDEETDTICSPTGRR